jgi:hypothetical protein
VRGEKRRSRGERGRDRQKKFGGGSQRGRLGCDVAGECHGDHGVGSGRETQSRRRATDRFGRTERPDRCRCEFGFVLLREIGAGGDGGGTADSSTSW